MFVSILLKVLKNVSLVDFADFFEERAILLGRLGRHEQALAIYVHVLQDNIMAEQLVYVISILRRHFHSSFSPKYIL